MRAMWCNRCWACLFLKCYQTCITRLITYLKSSESYMIPDQCVSEECIFLVPSIQCCCVYRCLSILPLKEVNPPGSEIFEARQIHQERLDQMNWVGAKRIVGLQQSNGLWLRSTHLFVEVWDSSGLMLYADTRCNDFYLKISSITVSVNCLYIFYFSYFTCSQDQLFLQRNLVSKYRLTVFRAKLVKHAAHYSLRW